MPVKRLLQEVDADELTYWMALSSVDPFTRRREDFRSAQVACVVANCHGGNTKPSDFIPNYAGTSEKPQNVADKVKAIFGGFSGVNR